MPRSIRPKHLRAMACGLLALVASACSTVDSRISDHQTAFDSYPPQIQQQIRAGQVNVGFTPDMVRMALGKPDDVYSQTTAKGTSEVWGYRDSSPLLGLSLGIGSFGGGVGGGVGVSTTTGGNTQDKVRVVFDGGSVSSVEQTLPAK